MIKKIFLIVILLTINLYNAIAITLQECKTLATSNYPAVKQMQLIKASEHYTLSNISRQWWPQGELVARGTWQTTVADVKQIMPSMLTSYFEDVKGLSAIQYGATLNIVQNIWEGGRINSERKSVKADAAEERERLNVLMYDIEGRVEELYFGVLLADKQIASAMQKENTIKSSLDKVKILKKNGVAMAMDVDMIEAALLSAGKIRRQLEANRISYLQMLGLFVGKNLEQSVLDIPERCNFETISGRRPEIDLFNAQQAKIEVAKQKLNASIMPKLSFIAQGTFGYPGIDYFASMLDHKPKFGALVGLQVSWNFSSLYYKSHSLRNLQNRIQGINIQQETFLFNKEQEMTGLESQTRLLRQELENDNRIVELRGRVRKAVESKLDNGVVDATELLQKIAEESSATTDRDAHEIELLRLSYKIGRNKGM